MALVACVWCSYRHRNVRPGNPQAVVTAWVDHHVVGLGHVAIDATGARRLGFVKMVGRDVIGRGQVTACTKGVSRFVHSCAVRIVTITARNARPVHLALQERAVHVHFVEDLSIRVVQALFEQSRSMRIEERITRPVVVFERSSASMTLGARFYLGAGRSWNRSSCIALLGAEHPRASGTIFKLDGETIGPIAVRPASSPQSVLGSGAVACLARNVDLRPGGVVLPSGKVEVLLQVGRVALGAHVVPVLVWAGPMERVVGGDFFVRIEVKPPLAAVLRRPAVPRDAQCLAPAVREFDEVLL